MMQQYRFAELSEGAIDEVQQLETRLQTELGEEVTLIAYSKDGQREAPACRADLEGE
ncbi:hypothetical protein [Paenibacillus alkalitolerans]|uniref:hypothetical protein n=1 Tax=Paenibacillus alkalitolerans TaxID=2799335 RepID=UPI0018F2CB81|nr:hypothetical protein [Paenibacillus alkalitolerans]